MVDWQPSHPDLPTLDVIGEQIVAAARRDEVARRGWSPRPRGRPSRTVLVMVLLVVLLASVAVAATQLIETGEPVPPPGTPTGQPHAGIGGIVPGTARLLAIRAPDPAGGPPWGLRVFRTSQGGACVQTGRVVGGRLGVLGQDGVFANDGRFHELPVAAEACGGLDAKGQMFIDGGSNAQTASGYGGIGAPVVGGCEMPDDRRDRTHDALAHYRAVLRLQLRRGETAAARVQRRVIARLERRARQQIASCPAVDRRDAIWGFAGKLARKLVLTEHGKSTTYPLSAALSGAYLVVLRGTFRDHQRLQRRVTYRGGIVCGRGFGVHSDRGCSPPPGAARPASGSAAQRRALTRVRRRPPPPLHLKITPLLGLAIRFTPPYRGHRYELMLRCGAKFQVDAGSVLAARAGRPQTFRLRGPLPPQCVRRGPRIPGQVVDAATGQILGTFRLHG